ncbi:branched-chain amino acid ABC transporter permease [Actinomadura physcomitrii]|uniref:branched-chain amino acid ABC transporter permease n=1 Tax=Actinomadura physcomitrii TaxID=2650748 RepID=UPI002E254F2F
MLQLAVQGLATGAGYALFAIGLILIHQATQTLNFAHGAMAVVGVFVGLNLVTKAGWNVVLACVAGVLVSGALGAASYVFVLGPLARRTGSRSLHAHLAAMLVTLGLLYILQSGTLNIFGSEVYRFPDLFGSTEWHIGDANVPSSHVGAMICTACLLVPTLIFIRRARWGLAMRAANEKPEAAVLMGVETRILYPAIWGIGSAIAALAGILIAPVSFVQVNMMDSTLIAALAAATVGGLSSLTGAVAGAVLLGVVQSYAAYGLGANTATIVTFLIIFVMLLLRPTGIVAERRAREL